MWRLLIYNLSLFIPVPSLPRHKCHCKSSSCCNFFILIIALFSAGDLQYGRNAATKDNLEEVIAGSDLGEEEMEVETEKEEEKPKAGSFANPLSSLNVLRPGMKT